MLWDSEESKSHFGESQSGDLKEPGSEVDILHCVPMKCIFVLVARAIAVSVCCHLKCGFLNLGLTLKLYSKYHGSIFLRVA